jgi:hypothetical protein
MNRQREEDRKSDSVRTSPRPQKRRFEEPIGVNKNGIPILRNVEGFVPRKD